MEKFDIDFLTKSYLKGKSSITETIKIMLYKRDENIFDKINFEDSQIYEEPLIFSFLNDDADYNLDWLLLGYMNKDEERTARVKSDAFGRIYIINIGWLITSYKNRYFTLTRKVDGGLSLIKDNQEISFSLEPVERSSDGKIEVLSHTIPLLKRCYYDTNEELLDIDVDEINTLCHIYLIKAIALIKKLTPNHYNLITLSTKQIQVFKIDTYKSNSFATIGAQGIAFLNAYQEDYNEIFFMDDIAHQTGHIIMNCIVFNKKDFFKISSSTILQKVFSETGELYETRDTEVLIHALFTYYSTFLVLDACLDENIFNGHKEHELLGRMAFYIEKCYSDFLLFEKPSFEVNKIDRLHHPDELFTLKGMVLYNGIKEYYGKIYNKWNGKISSYDLRNQPYNFTYSKFIQLNPLKEKVC